MWTRAGQSIATFWAQTPRTFAAVMRGYNERLEDEQRGRAWHVWHAGILGNPNRKGRYPTLEALSGRSKSADRQEMRTPDQTLATLRRMRRSGVPMTIRRVG